MLAVYGIVGGNEDGWASIRTLGILGGGRRRCWSGSSSTRPGSPSR